jgi:micrococcal nuclease
MLVLALLTALGIALPNYAPNKSAQGDTYMVTRVVDGDTIEVQIGGTRQKVRYIGINTPETVDPRRPVQCYGHEASQKNKELVEGRQVRLVKDVSETDKYGRLLRYVYVGDTFVNLELVRQGYAHASTYPPDVAHESEFREAERQAREAKVGLWSGACTIDIATSTFK